MLSLKKNSLLLPNKVEPFKYPAQDLTPPTPVHTMQGPVQEDIPVVRIHASRIEKVKAGGVGLASDDCILVSDPAEYIFMKI